MARQWVGAAAVVGPDGLPAQPGAALTLWRTKIGATPILDVLDATGAPIAGGLAVVDGESLVPLLQLDLGTAEGCYVSVDGGPRQWLRALATPQFVLAAAVADYLIAHPPTVTDHGAQIRRDDTPYAVGIFDRNDRALPLFRHDGGLAPIPLARAADDLRPLLTPVNSDGAPIWGVLDRDGRSLGVLMPDGSLAPVVLAAVRRQLAGPEVPVTEALCIGTSLTATTQPNTYPDKLAALGIPTINKGWAGRNSLSIASIWGAIPVPITAPVTIPAAGSVAVGMPWEVTQGPKLCTLAGIPGTLTVAAGVYSFTRATPGTATVAPKSSPLLITADPSGPLPDDRIVVIEASRNNPATQPPGVVIGHIRAIADRYARSQRPRVLVVGEPMATTDSAADKAARQARNAALAAAFPAAYVDAFEWLLTDEAAATAGVTLTTQDRADIAAGVTPGSYRADTLHMNATGNTLIAQRIYDTMTAKGWLAP